MTSGEPVRRSVWPRVLLVLAALLAAGIAVAWCTRPAAVAERELTRVLARLEARGVPTTFEDWSTPAPSRESNGWPDLLAAVAWRDARVPEGWRRTYVGPWNHSCEQPWWATSSEQDMDALAGFLGSMEPFFERIDVAVAKPTLRWELPPKDDTGWRFPSPDVLGAGELQRMLLARAHGAPDEPARRHAVVALARLAGRLDRRTTVSAALISRTLLRSACGTLRGLVEARLIDAAAAREDLDALLTVRCIDDMPATIAMERVATCEYVPHLIDGTAFPERSFANTLKSVYADLRDGRRPFARDLDIDRLLAVGLIDALDAAAALQPTWDRSYDERFAACFPQAPEHFAPHNMLHSMIERSRAVDAQSRLARVALAACVHHGAHGRWPDGPGELATLFADGDVPLDPYTGEAFVWSVDDGVLTLAARPWTARDEDPLPVVDDPVGWDLVWTLR